MLLLISIILIPFVEIAGFIIVGQAIGLFPTLGLILATAILGAILLRIQGFNVLQRLNGDMKDGGDPSRDLIHGAMIVMAGILLLIPGFVTDILGLLLFVPPIRNLVWKYMSRNMVKVSERSTFKQPQHHERYEREQPKVVDLDLTDFSKNPDPNSPWTDNKSNKSDD